MNDFTLYKKRVQIYTKFPNIQHVCPLMVTTNYKSRENTSEASFFHKVVARSL